MNIERTQRSASQGTTIGKDSIPLWNYLPNNNGSFIAPEADNVSRLYFPLFNNYGMKCSITPELKGDIASSFHHYLTPATVTEELHRNVSGRNFWISIENKNPWSVAGNSVFQKAQKWTHHKDETEVEGRLGAFISRRKNEHFGLAAEVTVFVPDTNDFVELMKVAIRNTSINPITFTPSYALPIFGRSADNFRDHRQVTTMFQKVFAEEHGVRVKPTIVHDEAGHSPNRVSYSVLGFDEKGNAPTEIWSVLSEFVGEGGSLDNPKAVFENCPAPAYVPGQADGKEAIGAFRFKSCTLLPGEMAHFIIVHGISENDDEKESWGKRFGSLEKFDNNLNQTLTYWDNIGDSVRIDTANPALNNWVKWVSFQLKCRQIYGNSFLPDFGYGRGGRGWRDLWQDLISIFLIDPVGASEEILNNFKGIRVDGSNATIIGDKPGEFKADRNNVPRTWSDHGTWPVFALNFYIHQTGNTEVLFQHIPYWKDVFICRSKRKDERYQASQGFWQLTTQGNVYQGSVLEHILIQQLTAFYHVGENNNLLLEGGDWNDTLDMAKEKGESVCFYNFYQHNFIVIVELLSQLKNRGTKTIDLLDEMLMLLDRTPGQSAVDYSSPEMKNYRLNQYFDSVNHSVSGEKSRLEIDDIILDLTGKANHIKQHIHDKEWIETDDGNGFFNGHYDNFGKPVHGCSNGEIAMDLASQVMPVLCNVADEAQVRKIYHSTSKYLKDAGLPGFRLCTEFKELNLNIGRISGFTYGYKEHGSKWSQQSIMFMYALFERGFVTEAYEIFDDVFQLCHDSDKSKIFPGVPSYFEPGDRGAYAYLTGSSTWLLLTLTTQIFGVNGYYGDLLLHPKLHESWFNEHGEITTSNNFRALRLHIHYHNHKQLPYSQYKIGRISINGKNQPNEDFSDGGVLVAYQTLLLNSTDNECRIDVDLQ